MASGPKNSEKLTINNNYFSGGTSISRKLGIANSFYYGQGLDWRTDPSQMSVLPGNRALATNLQDLITAMDQDLNGVRWGVGSNGGLYQINTSNVLSKKAQLTEDGSAGLLYNQVTDQLYIPGQSAVSMFGQVTSGIAKNPNFKSNQFAQSASVAPGCVNLYNTSDGFFDGIARNNVQGIGVGITEAVVASGQVVTNSTETYSVPSALSEDPGNFCFFAPDIEPFYSISVYLVAVGTGNATLTLHDSLNNTLATVTVNHASLVANSYNEFVFGKQVRALVSASQTGTTATYHWHLTSSVTSDTMKVGTINTDDLSSADFLLFAYRLISTANGWHPTALFTGSGVPQLCIGNGQYLSTYNFGNDANPLNSQWVRHALFFKPGYEVCGISTNNQYLVIAAERRSTNSSRNFQDGILYFWDGTTSAPNFTIDIPMGAPYGLYTFNNVTYFAVAGSLFAWSGGQTVIKVRKLAYQNTDYLDAVDNTIINPNMFTSRYNLLMMGYPSSTTNVNINYGIWSWGTVELTFPNSYGLSYTLSNNQLNTTGPAGTNLQIGCVQNFVDSMYTSWQYTSGGTTYYGLDILDNFSTPSSNFSWQSLIWDGGSRYKVKQALRMKISFLPLPTGCTVTPTYSLNRGAFIVADPLTGTSYTNSTVGSTDAVIEINNARFHEIQWGFNGTSSSGATQPVTITGVSIEINPLPDEIDIKEDG